MKIAFKLTDSASGVIRGETDERGNFENRETSLSVRFESKNGVSACFVNAVLSDACFHKERGIELTFPPFTGKFVANRMYSKSWSCPCFGSESREIPDRVEGLLLQSGKKYRCILPVCADVYKTNIEGAEEGVRFVVFSRYNALKRCENQLSFVSAESDTPEDAVARCLNAAFYFLNKRYLPRNERCYPEVLSYLGWCTWDAMHVHVNERGVLDKCREFKEKGIPVRWVILDDMWADCSRLNDIPEDADFNSMLAVQYRAWMHAFRADKERFPNGLKGVAEKLNAEGMKVGLWFPTTGYWFGFDPDGEVVRARPECFITLSSGMTVIKPEKEAFAAVYGAFEEYALRSGIAFLKIDRQSCFETVYAGTAPVGKAAHALQSSIEESVSENYGGALINCMGMSNENMFNRDRSAVLRCSGDFIPEDKDWFAKHIVQCAYNGLFWGGMHVCDWDMWWSNDGQALRNAVCRALSGGPIYISDKIGCSEPAILEKLCFGDGRILRAENAAMPVRECLFENPLSSSRPFAIFNRWRGSVALAAFDLNEKDGKAEGSFDLSQFAFGSESVAVYDFFERKAQILPSGAAVDVSLKDRGDFRLFILSEYRNGAALLGRTDKFLSPAAVTAFRKGGAELYEGGEIGVVSEKSLKFSAGGRELPYVRSGNLYTVTLPRLEKEFSFSAGKDKE